MELTGHKDTPSLYRKDLTLSEILAESQSMCYELTIESMLINRNKITRTICLVVCLGVLAEVLAFKWRDIQLDHQEQRLQASLPAVTLHSNRPYHEVRVPFRGKGGWINLTADSSGKAIDCILDTGSALAMWPQALSLAGTDAQFHYTQFTPYPGVRPRPADWRKVTDLKFGDYEMQDCLGIAYDADSGDAQRFCGTLLIGYPALAQTVVTIDFRKKEVVFRDKIYDVTRRPLGPRAYLLNMVANPEDAHGRYHQPIVGGTIAGHKVHLILDTGLAWGGVALAEPKIIAALQQATHGRLLVSLTAGTTDVKILPDTLWSVGGLVDQAPIDFVPGFVSGSADGVLGYEILRNYRITIDYGRQKILLERNPFTEDAQLRIQQRVARMLHSPRDPFTHIELGKAYLFADQYQKAEQEFARAVFLDPNNVFAHFKLGQCFYQLGRYSAASDEFERATRLDPADAFSYLWLGKALSRQGRWSDAHGAWQDAIAQDKTVVIAQEAQGLVKQLPSSRETAPIAANTLPGKAVPSPAGAAQTR